jgi:hypothetical protein
MSVTGWHLDVETAHRYAEGEVTPALASSVEQHLIACAECRAMLAPAVETDRLDRVWTQVIERVVTPHAGVFERLLCHLGVSEATGRLIAATPSLRAGWLSAVTTLLAVSLLVAHTGQHGIAVFFALAPLLPMLGVAVAFAPSVDRMYDMVSATPYDNFRLLLARAIAVVTTTLGLVLVAGFLLPDSRWLAVSWLLPALALSVATLAAAPRIQPVYSAAALTVVWLLVALPALRPRADPLLATHATVQLASLLALAVGAIVLVHRKRSLPAHFWRSS